MKVLSYSFAVLLVTTLVQALLVVHMARKQTFREFPIFFWYTAFVVCFSAVGYLILTNGSYLYYFYFYWIGNAISVVLGFAVIREVFHSVLARYEGILELSYLLFRWALVVLVAIAALAAAASPGQDDLRISIAVLTLERTVRIVQCGLLLFLFLFAKTLGLSWRHHSFGIAFGFALFAAVSVIVYGVRMHLGTIAADTVHILVPISYMLASFIWGAYLISPAPEPLRLTDSPPPALYRWNVAVLELLKR